MSHVNGSCPTHGWRAGNVTEEDRCGLNIDCNTHCNTCLTHGGRAGNVMEECQMGSQGESGGKGGGTRGRGRGGSEGEGGKGEGVVERSWNLCDVTHLYVSWLIQM